MIVCGEGHVGIFLFLYTVLWTLRQGIWWRPLIQHDFKVSQSLNIVWLWVSLFFLSTCSGGISSDWSMYIWSIYLLYSRMSFRSNFISLFLEQKIVFDFSACPWAVYFLVLCHQSSVSYSFHLMELALNHFRFWIITFTILCHNYTNIFYGQDTNVDQTVCILIDVCVSSQ